MCKLHKMLLFCVFFHLYAFASSPHLLIVMPTDGNPEHLFETLDCYMHNLSDEVACSFLVSCYTDDYSMNNNETIARLKNYRNLTYVFGKRMPIAQTYNRDLLNQEFDILFLAGDDVRPLLPGFDKMIVDTMMEQFPDLDGALKVVGFHAEYNTAPVIGKNWYQRFGYAFCPAYQSNYHTHELSIVSRMLRKEFVFDEPLVKNVPLQNGPEKKKKMGRRNNMDEDQKRDYMEFCKRQSRYFDITQDEVCACCTKGWSILICTIYVFSHLFEPLYSNLQEQIKRFGLEDRVEIVCYLDNRGEHSIGEKRNWLLQNCNGRYVNYLDDDDIIHEDYIKLIYDALAEEPDCVELVGIMKRADGRERKFVHSMHNATCSRKENTDYRPVTHLNTMKYEIAVQAVFPEISRGEDTRWWMRLHQVNLFKKEAPIDVVYYTYWPSFHFEKKPNNRPARQSNRRIARYLDNKLKNE